MRYKWDLNEKLNKYENDKMIRWWDDNDNYMVMIVSNYISIYNALICMYM